MSRRRRSRLKADAYFGTDNYAMGAQAGRIILDSIPQKGAVYITLMQAITNQFQQRIDGMAAAVQAVDGMRVVMDPHWESNRNQFQIASEIRNALEAHPDIVAIIPRARSES
jgi:ABC-type sugar transport system substrate-binding protein